MAKPGLHKVLQQPFSECGKLRFETEIRLLKRLGAAILCGKHLTHTLNNMGHLPSRRKQRPAGEKQ